MAKNQEMTVEMESAPVAVDYKVVIKECSKELTAKQRIIMKDTADAIKFDDVVNPGEGLIIKVEAYAVLSVHNEKSEKVDYLEYLVIADDGKKYYTSSDSFWKGFKDIWDELSGTDEEWDLKVFKSESSNYKGKFFITCSVI